MGRKEDIERNLILRGAAELTMFSSKEVLNQLEDASRRASLGDINGIRPEFQPALLFHDSTLLVINRRKAAAERIQELKKQREVFPNNASVITSEIKTIYQIVDSFFGAEPRTVIPEAKPQFRPSYQETTAIDFALKHGISEVINIINFPSLGGVEPNTVEGFEKQANSISEEHKKTFSGNNRNAGFNT